MSDVNSWYPLAASNNASPPNGFPEGMLPDMLNNAAREMMAAMRRSWNNLRMNTFSSILSGAGASSYPIRLTAWSGSIGVFLAGSTSIYSSPTMASGDWTSRTSNATGALYAVCWSGTLFVAVGANAGGDANIVTSPDGITWTKRTAGVNTTLRDVTYCAGMSKFIAVGDSVAGVDTILTSPDGVTWTARTGVFTGVNVITSVTSNGTNLAVCVTPTSTGTYNVQTSADGVTWTGRTISAEVASVTYGNSIYVATSLSSSGSPGRIWTSPDGTTWTIRTTGITDNAWKPYYDGYGTWWVGTDAKQMLYSTDNGATWSALYGGYYECQKRHILLGGGGRLFAAQNTGSNVYGLYASPVV